jgi:protein TonB
MHEAAAARPSGFWHALARRAGAWSGTTWAVLASLVAHAALISLLPPWASRSHVAEREPATVRLRVVPPAESVLLAAAGQAATHESTAVAPSLPATPARAPSHRHAEERIAPVLSLHREEPVARHAAPAGASQPEPAARAVPEGGGEPVAVAAAPQALGAVVAPHEPMQLAMAAHHSDTMRHTDVAYLHNPRPAYPPMARKLGLEGTVTLRIFVNREGVPEESRVLVSAGSEVLDSAALDAVRMWRFVPAREGKAAIAHWVDVPVTFRLAAR